MKVIVNKVYKIELDQKEIEDLYYALEYIIHKRENTQEEIDFYDALLNEIEDLCI